MSLKMTIVDQSLKDFTGHHFDYTSAVIHAFKSKGLDLRALIHKESSSQIVLPCPMERIFSQTWNQTTLKDVILGFWGLPVRRTGEPAQSFLATMKSQVSKSPKDNVEHFFIHTLNWMQFLSLVLISLTSRREGLKFHLVFRQDPFEHSRLFLKTIFVWMVFKLSNLRQNQFRFYTDTPELQKTYQSLSGFEFSVLPIIFLGMKDTAKPRLPPHSKTCRLGFFGNSRSEKGFQLLPHLVRSIIESSSSDIEFLIQVNLPHQSDSEYEMLLNAKNELVKLEERYPSQVKILHGELSDSIFYQLFGNCDVVLLPYNAQIYRRRSSGLLCQAILLEKIAIVPNNSSLATMKLPTILEFDDQKTLIEAVKRAIVENEKLKKLLPESRKIWSQFNNLDRFAETVIGKSDEKSNPEPH